MKVAVIGAGANSRRVHLPALKKIPTIEVVGIADIDEVAAGKVANEFHIPNYFISYEEMLKDDSIGMVDICTPPQANPEIIKLAAEKGKHILVEKPLALSLKEAVAIYQAIREHKVKLNVVQNYRYFPAVRAVKERLSKGYLGRVFSMHGLASTPFPSASTRSTWLYDPGGALYDFAEHLIDMLLWLSESPVKTVSASGRDITGGDMGFINYAQLLLEFENGTTGTGDVSWVTGILRFKLDICGTGGHIYLDVRNNNYMEIHGILTPFDEIRHFLTKMTTLTKAVLTGKYFSGAALFYKPLIIDFLKSIEADEEPPANIEHEIMVTAVLEAAEKSISQSRSICLEELLQEAGYPGLLGSKA